MFSFSSLLFSSMDLVLWNLQRRQVSFLTGSDLLENHRSSQLLDLSLPYWVAGITRLNMIIPALELPEQSFVFCSDLLFSRKRTLSQNRSVTGECSEAISTFAKSTKRFQFTRPSDLVIILGTWLDYILILTTLKYKVSESKIQVSWIFYSSMISKYTVKKKDFKKSN